MNNYGFENRNYNRKSYSAAAFIAAFFSVLFEMIRENRRLVAGIKITLATLALAIFFGVFGGIETGMISATVGFSVCAAIALAGIIFCGEK